MKKITLKAYAKINLGLSITGIRSDGYHNIETVMQTVALYDLITLVPCSRGIRINCSLPELNSKDNLAYKAALALKEKTNGKYGGVEIKLKKNIPISAGMGGGSANAAAVLRGLALMWRVPVGLEEMIELGSELGSDVPYCLIGGTAFACGRGESLVPLSPINDLWVLLIKPRIKISTEKAYNIYDRFDFKVKSGTNDDLITAVEKGDKNELLKAVYNDFEQPIFLHYPFIKKLKKKIMNLYDCGVLMTGSGSTVYALTYSKKTALKIKDNLQSSDLNSGIERYDVVRVI